MRCAAGLVALWVVVATACGPSAGSVASDPPRMPSAERQFALVAGLVTSARDLLDGGDEGIRVVPLVEEAFLRWSILPRLSDDDATAPDTPGLRLVAREALAAVVRTTQREDLEETGDDDFYRELVRIMLASMAGSDEDLLAELEAQPTNHFCGNCSGGRQALADRIRSVLHERAGDTSAALRDAEQVRFGSFSGDLFLPRPAQSLARLRRGLLRLEVGDARDGAADLQRLVDLCPGTTAAAVAHVVLAERDLLEPPTAERLVELALEPDVALVSRLVESAAIRHGFHDGRWPFFGMPVVETAPPGLSGVALAEHLRPDGAPELSRDDWADPRRARRVAAWATRPPAARPPDWREAARRVSVEESMDVLPDVARGGPRDVALAMLDRLADEGTERPWRVPDWHAAMLAAAGGTGPSLAGLSSEDVRAIARRWADHLRGGG